MEWAGAYKKNKNLFTRSTNNKSSVYFSSKNMADIGKNKNVRLTHNHPSASGFSRADLKMAVNHNLKQIRAVGYNKGYNHHYIMQRKGEKFNKTSNYQIEKTYASTYNKYKEHNRGIIAANKAVANLVGGKFRYRKIKPTWEKKSASESFSLNISKVRSVKMPKSIKKAGIDSVSYKKWVKKNWT